MKLSRLATRIGDRMLGRLVPETTADAALRCWTQSKTVSCGVGKYQRCRRTCCQDGTCGGWSCGVCAVG
ncbi:hypothetical protein LX16_3432 [Stackebrandtia albiflava]|uniref:Uncharacterized protein n=1 Tax=Stackebrandtia albiflava TaxID=406432 RepID=A0A562V465_9ACTN|nr:hypothetical protein [Stackebrandtia albiflava]TWJ12670.1 hypothetical protein LX16_3432 [Stackebrandtia albiflava]